MLQQESSAKDFNKQIEKLQEEIFQLNNTINEKEAILKELFLITDNLPVFVSHLSLDLKYLYVNDRYAEVFGMTKDEIIGKFNVEILGQESFTNIKSHIEKASTGQITKFINRTKDKNLNEVIHQVSYIPIIINNLVDSYVVLAIDITEFEQIEETLKEREYKINEMEQIVGLGSWTYDPILEQFKLSNELFNILGIPYSEGSIDILELKKCVFTKDIVILDDIIQNSVSSGKPFVGQLRILRPENSERTVVCTSEAIIDHTNKVVRLKGTIRDITGEKQAERMLHEKNEQLQKLNNEKDKFFSIIAHDLRSPFTSVLGIAALMPQSIAEKNLEELKEFTEMIILSATKATDLLKNLMDWSRSQTGRIAFNPTNFDISLLIKELTQFYSPDAIQKSITLNNDVLDSLFIVADKDMISTVLRNLISNAIKFTNVAGSIVVRAKQQTDVVRIEVQDSGVGISETGVKKLFELSTTYSTSGTKGEQGTGLGLILCKEFVDRHKGNIWIESELGKGSSFIFTIPNN